MVSGLTQPDGSRDTRRPFSKLVKQGYTELRLQVRVGNSSCFLRVPEINMSKINVKLGHVTLKTIML